MPLNTPAQWKVRAQEARVLAEALKAHPEAFAAVLKIAMNMSVSRIVQHSG